MEVSVNTFGVGCIHICLDRVVGCHRVVCAFSLGPRVGVISSGVKHEKLNGEPKDRRERKPILEFHHR